MISSINDNSSSWFLPKNKYNAAAMTSFITHLARSVAFLSRIPVPARFFTGDDGVLTKTSSMFSIAGLVIALPTSILAGLLLWSHAHSMIIVALVIAMQVLITGALHEDGLSDCADGLWGGKNRGHILEIMHDSALGTYGTLSLILLILAKFSALLIIAEHTAPMIFSLILLYSAALSRGAMVWHWHCLPPAREDGVAATVGQPSRSACIYNAATLLILTLGLYWLTSGDLNLWLAILVVILIVYVFTKLINRKINGHTGDTIGATQQLTEIAFLVTLALWIT